MSPNYTAIAMITSGHTMLKTVALIIEDEELLHVAGCGQFDYINQWRY